MRLRGDEVERLSDAMRVAFSPDELRRLVRTARDLNLDDISMARDYQTLTWDVIEAAERGDWLPAIVAAAQSARPANPTFPLLALRLGAAPTIEHQSDAGVEVLDSAGLERIVVASSEFVDIETFATRMLAAQRAVCRVELDVVDGTTYGTGVLVAPDLVLTNHHVAAPLLGTPAQAGIDPRAVRLRFDYRRLPGTASISDGRVVPLADSPVHDFSAATVAESGGGDPDSLPAPDELDFAILRTAEPIGEQPVDEAQPRGASPRGWLHLAPPPEDPGPGQPVIIVQHPESQPMQIALDSAGVLSYNANRTRVRYRTNTLPGSSGSPCFDQRWRFFALHHFGDPSYWLGHRPGWNQGVPIRAIAALLDHRGTYASVAAAPPPSAGIE